MNEKDKAEMVNEPIFNFRCEKLGLKCLQSPCEKNLLKIKEHRLKFTHAVLPIPLEHCEKCGGRDLVSLNPGGEPVAKKKNLMTPAVARDLAKKASKPYRQDWDPNPEVTTAPRYLKDVVKKEPEMQRLSPEKIAEGREAVKKLSESYKIAADFHFKPKKQEEPVPTVKITEREAVKMEGILPEAPDTDEAPRYWPPAATLEALEVRYCKAHPKVPQRKDRLGRWMGMCTECLSARGKKCGLKNVESGNTAPPMVIPLNLPKYAELKAWLVAQADENERTLTQQIVFILKTAWRQGV